ncbi:MAG: glycosyltransferase [Chitinophagaceae bacterium]|nr:glycosyltransferase [Chitinophagaceae bacterium]
MSDLHRTKVLIITGILPVADIIEKKDENDILLITEDNIKIFHSDIEFDYIFTSPKVNKILSLLSTKWRSYYKVQQQEQFGLRGRVINTLGIIMLPKKFFFRNILYNLSFWLNRNRIEYIIKKTQPTIIHAQSIGGNAFFAKKISKKYNIPYIVTLRGLNEHTDHLVIKTLESAKHLIAISPTQKRIAEKIIKETVNFIPHGVSDHFFTGNKEKTVTLPLRFMVVCRLLKLKNIDKVIKEISSFGENYTMDIYGEGPEKENLQTLIEQLNLTNRIKLKGYILNESLPYIYKEYDIFIMPSIPETLGRVYFEAMAGGLPVIASKDTGVDGIVTDGIHGYLVNHKDDKSLYKILNLIFSNPENIPIMRKHALELSKQFRWESISELLYNIYKN